MDNQEEQNIEVQSDPYLESPKAVPSLEMLLYHVFLTWPSELMLKKYISF